LYRSSWNLIWRRERWAGADGWHWCWFVAVWAVAGCSGLSSLGIESRGARLARQYAGDKDMLQTQLASTEAEKAQVQSDRDAAMARYEAAQKQINDLNQKLIALAAPKPTGSAPFQLSGDVLFRPGKVDVRPEAKPTLLKVANIVKQAGDGAVVYVDGHTDSDPLVRTKGLYRDNYGLAQARANAVARQLTEMGVPRSKLVTRSFGPDRPVADNKTAAGKKQNRRVEISVAQASGGAASTMTHVSTAAKADAAPVHK